MNADTQLLLAFSHTREDTDQLGSPDGLEAWLGGHGLWEAPGPITPEGVRRVVHLRAAISALLRENLGGESDPRTRPTIEEATRVATLRIGIEPDGALRLVVTGKGVERAMAEIVAALYRVQAAGELERLKLCKACGFAFYDTSKNRSRIWCDMAICGSQEKARAYRRRQSERSA